MSKPLFSRQDVVRQSGDQGLGVVLLSAEYCVLTHVWQGSVHAQVQ